MGNDGHGDDGIASQLVPSQLVPDELPRRVERAAARLNLGSVLGAGRGTAPRGRPVLYAFRRGLVITGSFGLVIAARRWTQVRSLRFDLVFRAEHQQDIGSVVHRFGRLLAFEFTDGRRLELILWDRPDRTLASAFFRYGMREDVAPSLFASFTSAVRDKVAQVQLAEVARRLTDGAEVDFGPFAATPQGLRHGDTLVRWAERPLICFDFGYSFSSPDNQAATVSVCCGPVDGGPDDLGPARAKALAREVPDLRTLERLCDGMQADPPVFTVPGARQP